MNQSLAAVMRSRPRPAETARAAGAGGADCADCDTSTRCPRLPGASRSAEGSHFVTKLRWPTGAIGYTMERVTGGCHARVVARFHARVADGGVGADVERSSAGAAGA